MEKHVLILWLNGNPIIDGAYYFDTRECMFRLLEIFTKS